MSVNYDNEAKRQEEVVLYITSFASELHYAERGQRGVVETHRCKQLDL